MGFGVQNIRACGGGSHGVDGAPQHGTISRIQSTSGLTVGDNRRDLVEARAQWRQIDRDADQGAVKVTQGLTGLASGDLQALRQVGPGRDREVAVDDRCQQRSECRTTRCAHVRSDDDVAFGHPKVSRDLQDDVREANDHVVGLMQDLGIAGFRTKQLGHSRRRRGCLHDSVPCRSWHSRHDYR